MIVVSSFSHEEVDLRRASGDGVRFLKDYLRYAGTAGAQLGETETSSVPLNPFEADICDALKAAGIPLVPQYGVSKYRIDLVATHPKKPGRYVLAIECDGASYHSCPTARDRDRLRQEQLENLGWKFHRIWSTDWFMNREQEIRRAKDAFERAVRLSDTPYDENDGSPPRGNLSMQVANPIPKDKNVTARGARPNVAVYESIDYYSNEQIDRIVAWIRSDKKLRTDQQIIEETIAELGFKRRGKKIVARIKHALMRLEPNREIHVTNIWKQNPRPMRAPKRQDVCFVCGERVSYQDMRSLFQEGNKYVCHRQHYIDAEKHNRHDCAVCSESFALSERSKRSWELFVVHGTKLHAHSSHMECFEKLTKMASDQAL